MKLTAIYRYTSQTAPDDFETCTDVLICDTRTTLGEIMLHFRNAHPGTDPKFMNVQIVPAQEAKDA